MLWADDAFAIAMGCVVRRHAGFKEYFVWISAEGPEKLLVQFARCTPSAVMKFRSAMDIEAKAATITALRVALP